MTVRTEQIEELLELWWTAGEDGMSALNRRQLPKELLCFLPHPIAAEENSQQETIDAMLQQGLLVGAAEQLRLSPAGSQWAKEIVRRHRLTEVLLDSVLEVSGASVESTACQVEHILNAEVTEAVCLFLGHPPSCPHGRTIPRGVCCRQMGGSLQALLVPLPQLAVGEEATVVLLHGGKHEYLQRLHTYGLVPGRRIRLRQTHPAMIVQIGQTELAFDLQLGQQIIVRRRIGSAASPNTAQADTCYHV
ncbi:MAG: FeoA domain-containing protein [Candidatus Omnitrophica bacterium]|nr:FeoA domain-containing protein [Candidatus Omnitrophota bacterium]